jgi:hypothetical protein
MDLDRLGIPDHRSALAQVTDKLLCDHPLDSSFIEGERLAT